MANFRSENNRAIGANLYKEYSEDGRPNYYYELTRSWKSKSGDTGYSSKFFHGYADAIADVAEQADVYLPGSYQTRLCDAAQARRDAQEPIV